jgi:hypothetical protein
LKHFTLHIVLFFLLCAAAQDSHAQVMDSLRSGFHRKSSFLFKIDSRNSFIYNRRGEIFGIKLGVEFDKQLRVGGGMHWLTSVLTSYRQVTSASGKTETVTAYLELRYLAYFIEYIYFKTKRWELSIPFQFGGGYTRFSYDHQGRTFYDNKKLIGIYEPGISTQFKIFRWMGVGADIGLRVMAVDNSITKHNFNSPTYAFKLLVWYDELYKMAFPNTKLAKRLGAGENEEVW